jgi:glucose-6-phosphate isomerase
MEPTLDRIAGMGRRIAAESATLVVVGIGGSYLGARAAYEALGRGLDGVELQWAGWSLSPVMARRLVEALDGRDYMINVISKSGGTMEPALAFRILAQHAQTRYGDAWTERVVVTTDPAQGALRLWAQDRGVETMDIPSTVGGRFSVLSPVGLLPLAAAGIDVRALVSGAGDVQRGAESASAEDDPAVIYAAARCVMEQRGRCVEVLTLPGPELSLFGEWWRQLAGESEGKNGAGIWPSVLTLTTDLHSIGQYLQDGRRMIQETFLAFEEYDAEPVIPRSGPVADGLDLVGGRALGLVNRLALEGTRDAHRAGDVPGTSITAHRLDPFCLGQLFYVFELAVALTALFHGVNPFDQPGVEAYKKGVRAKLNSL